MSQPSPQTYFGILIILLILLLATMAAALLDLGRWGIAIALGIAVAKSLLILLYFMHVRFGPRATIAFAGAGFVWLGILIVLTCSDYLTRNHPPDLNYKGEPRYLMNPSQ